MPSLDGPYVFLTVLFPLHTDPCARADKSFTSPAHAVREFLSTLPTAQHSKACTASGRQSPFARNLRTHFARFAVIDGPAFEGREPRDAILTALHLAPDPTVDPVIDHFARPYLMFCADFDRLKDDTNPVDTWLRALWSEMGGEWREILAHCEGWAGPGDETQFVHYLNACAVETTMPFNDYPVDVSDRAGTTPILGVVAGALGAAALVLVAGLFLAQLAPSIATYALAIVVPIVVAVVAAAVLVLTLGRRSANWSAGLDLPSVLKALYVQAAFARFAAAPQQSSPADLQAAFRVFLSQVQLDDLTGPTQSPGVTP